MKNLFKYAAEHWKSLIAIIVVLFIQAYCEALRSKVIDHTQGGT